MRKKDQRVYLLDMVNYCNSAINFVSGFTYKSFSDDEKTVFAVIRAIEVIGEASKKVSQNIKDKYDYVPWREIAGMRDKVVHEYFGIDKKVVWNTAKNDIPNLKKHPS